jgi:hypothetical protein
MDQRSFFGGWIAVGGWAHLRGSGDRRFGTIIYEI